jgi:glutamate dehydrogenase
MEGLHLRGGKISRGGIRWSDRPDDFRTEILGLMQTQMSKNALIVPTGAKGGFIVKNPASGLDFREAGKQAYMTLIRGLLDLTDNYVDDQIVQLPGIVSYDEPDPYLVVAADKGTAQFPDIANAVAAEYHFWLADAFASGGSKGYNHKQLGITARGAWECVKRHFRELGKNIQAEVFTVVGIGSMDGDVFGNGMLLSPYIQLKAAISGRHIFIDPNPVDVEKAFQERKRLFELPGSSWADYDRELISQGGGVYRRDAKSIPISGELKKWLKIRYRSLDAESLIRYLLCAQVDLLWFGGIGTYVKSSSESHGDAGDRANDNVRVDAFNIQAKVVGEGANLGFTQKGRVEYALSGGHINTDAIDNSAGVDISDHEVNLKIFLSGLKKLQVIDDYQPLFLEICPDVCDAVLANNYAQSLCLSLDSLRSEKNPDVFLQVADYLENLGLLDRQMEAFSHSKEFKERQKAGLTRPELAVLMASSKIRLKQQILEQQSFIQSDCYDSYLLGYFPRQVVSRFQKQVLNHPLAKQIKATVISSQIVNHAGCGFLHVGIDEENSVMIDAVSCYLTFDQMLKADSVRKAVFSLDNQISTDEQYALLMILENSLSELCYWQRLHQQQICPDLQTIGSLQYYYESYENYFNQYIEQTPKLSKQLADYQYKGIPYDLSRRIIIFSKLDDFPVFVSIAMETKRDMAEILELFETTKVYLGLNGLDQKLLALPQHDFWEKRITLELRDDIKQALADVVKKIMLEGKSCQDYFMHPDRKLRFEEFQEVLQQINDNEPTNLLPFIALNKVLQRLK